MAFPPLPTPKLGLTSAPMAPRKQRDHYPYLPSSQDPGTGCSSPDVEGPLLIPATDLDLDLAHQCETRTAQSPYFPHLTDHQGSCPGQGAGV